MSRRARRDPGCAGARAAALGARRAWPPRPRTSSARRSARSPSSPRSSRASCRRTVRSPRTRAAAQPGAARCRDILAELAAQAGDRGGAPLSRGRRRGAARGGGRPASPRRSRSSAPRSGRPGGGAAVARRPEIVHGLGNLIQNAVQFARGPSTVRIDWDPPRRSRSDGRATTARASRSAFSTGSASPIFRTGRERRGRSYGPRHLHRRDLLERTGARLEFDNRPEGGGAVRACAGRARGLPVRQSADGATR